MRKILIYFFLISSSCFAQQGNDKTIPLDSLWNVTTADKQFNYRIIKEYTLEKPLYRFEDYYKSGKLKMEGNSDNKEFLSKEGLFKQYYENGQLKRESFFADGKPTGIQTDWYENGVKKREGEYVIVEGLKKPQLKIIQFWTSENKQTVTNGTGYVDDVDVDYSEKGTVLNGWKDGDWEGKDNQIKFSYKEKFNNGKLVSGTSIDKFNVEHAYDVIELEPRPKRGLQHFYNYIGRKFRIPKASENIFGEILLSFVINKEGNAVEVKVLKSLDENLDQQGVRLIESYPEWSPAEIRGIKVRVMYSIPIKIAQQ